MSISAGMRRLIKKLAAYTLDRNQGRFVVARRKVTMAPTDEKPVDVLADLKHLVTVMKDPLLDNDDIWFAVFHGLNRIIRHLEGDSRGA